MNKENSYYPLIEINSVNVHLETGPALICPPSRAKAFWRISHYLKKAEHLDLSV